MKESELERILVGQIRKAGGKAYKWISPGNDGVPDRIVFLPDGKICFVELKTDTGRLSAQQKVQIEKLQQLGADVRVAKGVTGLINLMQHVGLTDIACDLARRMTRGDFE